MRLNEKWLKYAVGDIVELEHPEDLVKLLYDGVHFAQVEAPYPSFLVKVAEFKSTGRAGLIWALQHSAFDGLALSIFLANVEKTYDDI
ncbi:hypothetical protein Slin15195_G107690 [Septoria linicola]|uniref:Uncharacterized protein n=1 Tax=Septoria linicola TaxID=215465 RepID=A0A9Q9ENV5_9PEZI|nr:hypothetical protein Slin14017_G105990 [Septoria linicola]USW57450.1 hypothetical protein Slin15195_G107690 [Septoria linicola]